MGGLANERVIFTAVADQASYRRAIEDFRQSLGIGLGSVALVFILVQALALRWGLTPLLRMQKRSRRAGTRQARAAERWLPDRAKKPSSESAAFCHSRAKPAPAL